MVDFDILSIVAALNAASLDPDQWQPALELIQRATRSFGVIMFPVVGTLPYLATRSMGESFERYVREGWNHRDERYRGIGKLVQSGLFTDADIMPEHNLRRSPYYQDFLAGCNLKGYAAVRVGSGDPIWALTLHRTLTQDHFSESELDALRNLSTHLDGVAEVASALGLARGSASLSAFDVAGKAAILFDRAGDVVRVNQLAEKLLDEDTRIVERRLVSSDRAATERFARALNGLLWSTESAGAARVNFPRRGRNPITVYLMRSFQLADTPLSAFHALAIFADPDARLVPEMQAIQAALGLTPAEARLVIGLQAGMDLQSQASSLGISRETAKKHLQGIFAKTGCRRQSELVAMLANFLPRQGG
ncbi:helix-turn-helix transcriptional regulator [Bradyrhizobium sp.]|uniref:helix-turn-helix transcriptional regulator n=1 Tax=Bradyrhizobium sp. TaxID=376 RepID=UPI0023864807|nr:helix-turn-helix transcriptional regulator [Bradyrhizobium sp.]MDE2378791.1 helix-turn-helix transcriptional regulator [Bradyrhizobium sp.]